MATISTDLVREVLAIADNYTVEMKERLARRRAQLSSEAPPPEAEGTDAALQQRIAPEPFLTRGEG